MVKTLIIVSQHLADLILYLLFTTHVFVHSIHMVESGNHVIKKQKKCPRMMMYGNFDWHRYSRFVLH